MGHKFEKVEAGKPVSEEAQRGFQGFMAVGTDEFGLFACTLGDCPKCEQKDQLVVFWNVHPNLKDEQKFTLPEGIEDTPSLIIGRSAKEVRFIGFTCGCYGKLHRQVAHIVDARKRRLAAKDRVEKATGQKKERKK